MRSLLSRTTGHNRHCKKHRMLPLRLFRVSVLGNPAVGLHLQGDAPPAGGGTGAGRFGTPLRP
jgi:hypothetical protein